MAGGAERVISFLTNNLNSESFDCKLIVIGNDKDVAYDIKKSKVKFLNEERVSRSIPKIVQTLRTEKPNIIISTVTHLNIAIGVASVFYRKGIYIARQAAITKVSFNVSSSSKKSWRPDLVGKILKKMDYIICQSEDMATDCIREFGVKEEKIQIIRNPITDNFKINRKSGLERNQINFITVGRLAKIKGHLRLIKILSKVKIPFIYTIVGDGPLKNQIFDEAKKLNIDSKIKHIPYTNKVAEQLSQNDYFLQGSLSEGFPNALLESCAVGTPVIAFDVPGGTKEIVENDINGFLVNTEDEFINHLNNLPDFDPKIVSDSVYKKFDKKIILNNYEEFFKEIVKRKEVAEKY
ncbi:glycosyltransferase [Maribacter sp.]|uniref:glycosyltransferase n=1 Tax=Maribacter sp. TaxID=1897614 RepID=UPI00329694F6